MSYKYIKIKPSPKVNVKLQMCVLNKECCSDLGKRRTSGELVWEQKAYNKEKETGWELVAIREGMPVNATVNKGIMMGEYKVCGRLLILKLPEEKRKPMLEELFDIKFWIT